MSESVERRSQGLEESDGGGNSEDKDVDDDVG